MGVFFRTYDYEEQGIAEKRTDNTNDKYGDSSFNGRDGGGSRPVSGRVGAEGIERTTVGGISSSSGNYTILLNLLDCWVMDIRHLDLVKPEIVEGSIDHKIMMCAR